MTEQQFCYWLQGFCELNQDQPTAEQWQSIREHLQTVFVKVTPVLPYPGTPLPKIVPVDVYPSPSLSPLTFC